MEVQVYNTYPTVAYPIAQPSADPYDLNIEVKAKVQETGSPQVNQLVTSKSLCTPGCGKTGTGNSFCC